MVVVVKMPSKQQFDMLRLLRKLGLKATKRTHYLKGKRFGRLVVTEEEATKKNSSWICTCDCGRSVTVKADHLINDHTRSCGCYAHEIKWKGCGQISGNYWCRITRFDTKVERRKVTITIEDAWDKFLAQNGKCALTGLSLTFSMNEKKDKTQTASLDRIDSNKGYTIDNVQWVHKTVQVMKMDLDEQEFVNFCKLISNTRG